MKASSLEVEVKDVEVEDFIQKEMNSDDPFVKILYRDLETRIGEYERDGSGIEKLKLSDLKAEIVMATAITAFLISVII